MRSSNEMQNSLRINNTNVCYSKINTYFCPKKQHCVPISKPNPTSCQSVTITEARRQNKSICQIIDEFPWYFGVNRISWSHIFSGLFYRKMILSRGLGMARIAARVLPLQAKNTVSIQQQQLRQMSSGLWSYRTGTRNLEPSSIWWANGLGGREYLIIHLIE